MTIEGFHAVVPAGGAGTRLWPLSRAGAPKFLHDLTGTGRSMLQQTWDRLLPLAGPAGVVLVTGAAHASAVRAQLPGLAPANLLLEPSPRDSMAAIGLAAAVLHRRDPDVVLGSFAADHLITDVEVFHDAVRQAVAAAQAGHVVTIGIAATHPSTAFGYVRSGPSLAVPGAPLARRVLAFVEKPDEATAAAYLVEGGYRWNAGMFVTRADVLLDHLAVQRPSLHDGLQKIARAWDTPQRAQVLAGTWDGLEKIAIDHAIAEPVAATGGVAVVPGAFGWDDVGDWDSLADLLPQPAAGPRVLHAGAAPGADLGEVVFVDARGLVVPGSGRVVAVVGMDDVVVVDTPDALLVTTRARAQDVKAVVETLRSRGRTDVL